MTIMRRRFERRFDKLLAADFSIELIHRKQSKSVAKELSEIESATTHLNAEFEKLNEYKQMINTQNKDIADIKMRIGEKEGGINLHKKNIRLHKKSKVKHIAELEADLQIPPDDQSYNFEKRVKNEVVLKCAKITMDLQMNNSLAIEQRRVFTLQGNNLRVITASPAESGRAAWELVGQNSGSNLDKWSELFGI